MIVDLPATSTSVIAKKLVTLRTHGGSLALGRVLTLVVVTDDTGDTEAAIEAANSASRQHPWGSSSPGTRRPAGNTPRRGR